MVDFYRALERLRQWKQNKIKVGCGCESEQPSVCRSIKTGVDTDQCEPCGCPCHKIVPPKE